ncbi:aldolase/citrate lyase family protein, partial [Klebsiella pneumoniae]
AIEDAIARVRKAGKAVGILSADETLARRYLELGATFVAVGVDTTVLMRGLQTLAGRFKNIEPGTATRNAPITTHILALRAFPGAEGF